MPADEGYLLANSEAQAGHRLDALSLLFNPGTFRRAHALGLGSGWRVWEVGAGGPSVPSWLAEQVGPTGQVLATDIDTSRLGVESRRYQVRRHDVGREPAPTGPFDWCTPGWSWCTCHTGSRPWPPWSAQYGPAAGCWWRRPTRVCSRWPVRMSSVRSTG